MPQLLHLEAVSTHSLIRAALGTSQGKGHNIII